MTKKVKRAPAWKECSLLQRLRDCRTMLNLHGCLSEFENEFGGKPAWKEAKRKLLKKHPAEQIEPSPFPGAGMGKSQVDSYDKPATDDAYLDMILANAGQPQPKPAKRKRSAPKGRGISGNL